MRALAVLAAVTVPGLAVASDATIVDACKVASALYFDVQHVVAHEIQAFPELDPPRVRMRVSYPIAANDIAALLRGDDGPSMSDPTAYLTCEFARASAPFGLSGFCPPAGCGLITPARLEEIQALMARQGL
jgi:hypothetical protein